MTGADAHAPTRRYPLRDNLRRDPRRYCRARLLVADKRSHTSASAETPRNSEGRSGPATASALLSPKPEATRRTARLHEQTRFHEPAAVSSPP